MQLSNKERKYRNKVMCENHFKKDIQKYIDSYIVTENDTYKNLYLNYSLLQKVLVLYNFSKLTVAMKDFATSCSKATNAFKNLAISWKEAE